MPTSTIARAHSDYRALANRISDAGLLDRRPASYIARILLTAAAFGGAWLALLAVGDSWASLGIAPLLAVLFVQVDFVAHDAGHLQIFESRRSNWLVGLVAGNLLTGLSFGWWVPKHNAHHAHPNVVGRDPDIGAGALALAFTVDDARSRRSAGRLLARYQAWLFFPLLLLEGAGLHISGVDHLLRRRDRSAAVEGLLLAIHGALYLTVLLWVLSPLRALAFLIVQQGLFGLYLGCSFAPNHKGMPILQDGSELDFLQRQIMTSRNVSGSALVPFMLGGLNYQIEHHLFPTMPRCNLPLAQRIVRAFCVEQGIAYEEDNLVGSYRQALRHLKLAGAG